MTEEVVLVSPPSGLLARRLCWLRRLLWTLALLVFVVAVTGLRYRAAAEGLSALSAPAAGF